MKHFLFPINFIWVNSHSNLNRNWMLSNVTLCQTHKLTWALMPNIPRGGAGGVKGIFDQKAALWENSASIMPKFVKSLSEFLWKSSNLFVWSKNFYDIQRDFVSFVSRSPWIAIVQIVTKSHVPKNIAARILCKVWKKSTKVWTNQFPEMVGFKEL